MTDRDAKIHKPPLAQPRKIEIAATLVVALLVALLALAGLLAQATVYPSTELRRTFVSNDLVNLLVGLPFLLGVLWLAWRGWLLGLLCWPGALLFVTYNAIAYVYALPPGWPFLLNVTLLALTLYTLIAVVARIDSAAVQRRLAGHAPVRLASGVLIGLGVLFLLRSAGVIATAGTSLLRTELAVLVADFLTTPAWIIGGALLWRRQKLGYVAGVGLLFQATMLFSLCRDPRQHGQPWLFAANDRRTLCVACDADPGGVVHSAGAHVLAAWAPVLTVSGAAYAWRRCVVRDSGSKTIGLQGSCAAG